MKKIITHDVNDILVPKAFPYVLVEAKQKL